MNFPKFNLTNYLLRHIQVMLFSLGQLWRQPLSSMMTIIVIGIALALPAGLYVLLDNVKQVSDQWDDATQISLFLQKDVAQEHAIKLTSQLEQWPQISNIHYQSSSQSLEEFRQLSGLGTLLDSLPSNPLPAIIIIQPNENDLRPDAIGSLLAKLEALPEVEQAQLDMEWLLRLRSINKTVQRGISILGLLLSLSVLLIIGNTIRLAILSRQSEIRVIKLVGGTNAFVRRPFLYTGFWYGTLGGIMAWLTLTFSLSLINSPVNELAKLYSSQFTLHWLSALLLIVLPITGLVLGVLGAWISVGRHLNAIEPN
ncbi:MAG: permease-like cell division protein FtsX [Gammaproteobacteria bacterium]|nr:permease-like cell division protein FtsX [Gammaproteobacteria bacterium]